MCRGARFDHGEAVELFKQNKNIAKEQVQEYIEKQVPTPRWMVAEMEICFIEGYLAGIKNAKK